MLLNTIINQYCPVKHYFERFLCKTQKSALGALGNVPLKLESVME